MGEQKITAVIEDRRIIFKFDVTKKLSDLRKYLIDEKYIVIDAEEDTWRFYKVKDSKVSKTEDMDEEKYIPVCEYIYDTDKILVGNLKKSLNVFADTLHEFFRFDVSNNLEDLRKYLIDKKFITADEELSAWRFVSPSAKDLKNVTEAIIGIQSEDKMVVKDFLYGSNKVRMVNVNRKKNPDLIGVDADYLLNRDIEVRIIRNDSVSPDKLAPIIMTNVRPANKLGIRTDFENVVLCEKETAIGIRISTRTHGGFIYSIKLQEGKDIRGKGYSPHTGFTTYAYEGTRNAIKVVSYKDLEIPTQQAVGYRRVTVNVWRFISYVDCDTGKKFIVDDNAPKPKPKARAMSILSGGVDVVTGDSIEGGGFVEGDDTENYISGCIQDIVEDENELLGTFEIDFFVFKTAEDAQNMVESRINPEYE